MQKEPQIKLPIKSSRLEGVYKVKQDINNKKAEIGVIPYWRNFTFVFTLVFSILVLVAMDYYFFQVYLELPSQIPLVYNQSISSWNLIDKNALIIFPLVQLGIILIIFKINTVIYHFDRRLVQTVNYGLILSNILLAIALFELLSFVLVY